MSKSPTTPKFKIELCEKYLSGEGSCRALAAAYGVNQEALRRWGEKYKEHGSSCFFRSPGNFQYSKEFKKQCVEAVLSGQSSISDIVTKYNISHNSVLRHWTMQYNANVELKDHDPKWGNRRKQYLKHHHKVKYYNIPTRRVRSISKLSCIVDLIRRYFDLYRLYLSLGLSEILLSKIYQPHNITGHS